MILLECKRLDDVDFPSPRFPASRRRKIGFGAAIRVRHALGDCGMATPIEATPF